MDKLIFDRKSEDVTRLKTLRTKVRNRTATTAEYEEWLSSLKGAYNNTDFNRVGEAINFLADILNSYGYTNDAKARTNWEVGEKPNPAQMADYIKNLNKLKNAYFVLNTTPNVPQDMEKLTFGEANDIEKFLFDINEIIKNMEKVFIYGGVPNSGQERIWQQRFRRPVSEIEIYTLTNIIPDPSFENNKWNDTNNNSAYSTVEKAFGNRSLYFATGTTIVANIEIPRPIVGHKYYGRRYIKSNGNNEPADSRFEVWGGDGENKNWVYAWNNGNHPDWEFNSSIHEIKGVDYADRTIIRCFNVGTTADTWVDGLMLIDLTECFGAGKEPNVFWCDRNIPYFEGTKTIEVKKPIGLNYKVFGNAEQATREGYNMIQYYDTFRAGGTASGITPSINSDGTLQVVATAGNVNWHTEFWNVSQTFTDKIENNMTEGETFTIAFTIKKASGSTGKPNIYIKSGMGYYAMNGTVTEEYSEIYYTGTWKKANNIVIHIGWRDCVGTFTIKNWMIKKGTYQPIQPYGVMPSPNYPSTVYGLGSRTRNKFDINGEINLRYDGSKIEFNTVSNGILTSTANASQVHGYGQRIYVGAGNPVTLSAKFLGVNGGKVTDESTNIVAWIVLYEDNIKETRKIKYIKQIEKDKIVFCSFVPTTDYIYATFDMYKGTSSGDYISVSFTDIQVEISPYPTKYIPFKSFDLKQKVGDNIISADWFYEAWAGRMAYTIDKGKISMEAISTEGAQAVKLEFAVPDLDYYTFSCKCKRLVLGETDNRLRMALYYTDDGNNYKYIDASTSVTNVEANKEYTLKYTFKGHRGYRMFLYNHIDATVTVGEKTEYYNIMLNKGKEPLPYIPFIELNKYIDFTNHEPLMKVGDVEDYVDYEKGKILRRIGKAVFDGSSDENWAMTYGTGLFDNQSAGLNFTTNNALCSHFIFNKIISGLNAGLKDGEFAFQPQYDNRPIFFKNLAFTTVTDWRNWLASNPITVWYELAEPYYEEIDLPSIQKISGEYSLTAYDEYLDGRVEKR